MNKTVYIIGAGASQEAGLPVGDQFKNRICTLLDLRFEHGGQHIGGDDLILRALRILAQYPDGRPGDVNPYIQKARHIKNSMPLSISIDNFIDAHPDDDKVAACGKLAIVRSILQAEGGSKLYFDKSNIYNTINTSSLAETWYSPFFKLLTENCSYGDKLKERFESIVLIVFNYDRCIEHFLYHSLQIYYDISGDKASELISCLNIYHPYGTVGSLPWQATADSTDFGVEPNPPELVQLAGKIKTFTEGTDPESSEISEIRSHINIAPKLVFLGFAFHKLNMELIASDKEGSHARPVKCYATTHGFSESDKKAIGLQIRHLRNGTWGEIGMAAKKCSAFFKEFSKSLAF